MPFSQLRKDSRFSPTSLETMRMAFEDACQQLKISADDPRSAKLANEIIARASAGERDQNQLTQQAIAAVS